MSPHIPEKFANLAWIFKSNPTVHWGFKVLLMSVLLGLVIFFRIDGMGMSSLQRDFVVLKINGSQNLVENLQELDFPTVQPQLELPHLDYNHSLRNLTDAIQSLAPNDIPPPTTLARKQLNNSEFDSELLPQFAAQKDGKLVDPDKPLVLPWVSAELEANFSSSLLADWLAPGGEPCKDSRTEDISISGLDGQGSVRLSTGDVHEFTIQALDGSGKPHCVGGDYLEIDLSGETWKSRPPIKDLRNGTYTFRLQVHPDFNGTYNLTIILLFRHYEGLKFSTPRFAVDKVLRVIPINFHKSSAQMKELSQCRKSDFVRDIWAGRWTRHAKNDSCPIDNDGRYRCQELTFPCQKPWCDGPLGSIESNGWIYSTHCSFKMFTGEEAWNCLSNRWIFWWGDSNHCDTIRNIINFVLGLDFATVPRRFDMNITNPKNPSQVVRITSIFNGHWNETSNYLGLNSLENEEYRELLKNYFSQDIIPDTIIMNSGLHDGIYWHNLRRFIIGADYAAAFWSGILEGVKSRGLALPEVIYRTTVATGGYARSMGFNPSKMEAFNGVVLDKLRQYNVVNRVIDDFDMTFPWHYDNRANDGVHYGRAPAKMKWRDGLIGHQYFVDLMLGHVLLNVLCTR
ncbi:OLC1v1020186C1 [Oldenlandia corymbosa var. corymbosa]|uniref:OLC1v1020186C1 n=1 Tax=Oldenlandia corymbosa var. corymbosa TaxID=529605 RepID=A0AAV1EFR4_OLDCO|nr:OLC1v1020186C1 [Oldenlandia corymbosa var. corymbosa]